MYRRQDPLEIHRQQVMNCNRVYANSATFLTGQEPAAVSNGVNALFRHRSVQRTHAF